MIRVLTKKWKDFRASDKGGVLIFVGLTLLPLFLILGLAVDSSYGLSAKRKLQMACDAAAKAGAANGGGVLQQQSPLKLKMLLQQMSPT